MGHSRTVAKKKGKFKTNQKTKGLGSLNADLTQTTFSSFIVLRWGNPISIGAGAFTASNTLPCMNRLPKRTVTAACVHRDSGPQGHTPVAPPCALHSTTSRLRVARSGYSLPVSTAIFPLRLRRWKTAPSSTKRTHSTTSRTSTIPTLMSDRIRTAPPPIAVSSLISGNAGRTHLVSLRFVRRKTRVGS